MGTSETDPPGWRLVPEGMRITHPEDDENPFEVASLYSWRDDTLDIRYVITPSAELLGFEMGVASYLAAGSADSSPDSRTSGARRASGSCPWTPIP